MRWSHGDSGVVTRTPGSHGPGEMVVDVTEPVTTDDAPIGAPSGQQVSSTAANVGAGLALVGVVVVSYLSMVWMSSSLKFFVGGTDLADFKTQRATGTVALVLLGVLIVIAVTSVVKGGTGARVTAGIAVVFGMVGVGVFGLLTYSAQQNIHELTPDPPAEAEPTCGPDFRPPFFGPDDTFRACDADAKAALAAAQDVVVALADAPSTADALRRAMSDAGLEEAHVHDYGEASVTVRWVAAPIACAVVTGDVTGWHATATEVLMDGGCSNHPAGTG